MSATSADRKNAESAAFIADVAAAFESRFGRAPAAGARAPGRVNLIGEHTDYTEGLVLPCAIDLDTLCFVAPRDDGRVHVRAEDLDDEANFDALSPRVVGGWIDYVQAVFSSFGAAGHTLTGMDLIVSSRVPRESGLSSSAALGVSVACAVSKLMRLDLDARAQAELVHRGECNFVGVGCGILDQFASALGRRDHALRIDCRSGAVRPIAMPPGQIAMVLVHSEVERALAGAAAQGRAETPPTQSAYRDRVEECARALVGAKAAGVGGRQIEALRDLGVGDLPALEQVLDPLVFRRARHVISENERVEAFVRALEAGNLTDLGPIMREGQASLREDYDVSTPELDALCTWGDADSEVYGSRLTGAGFGGCALHLVRPAAAARVRRDLAERFEQEFGRTPRTFAVQIGEGASEIPLPS